MSKRKSKKSKKPNLPQSTLERARRQLDGDDVQASVPADETPTSTPEAVADNAQTDAQTNDEPSALELAKARREQQRRIREQKRVQNKQSDARNSSGELDNEYIRELLAKPTKMVTEEEMHAEYGHVIIDLRNMGLLAAALLVLLVFLAQVL